MDTSEYIKSKAESVNNNTYGKQIANKSSGYINGAIAGGVIGVLSAAMFKGRYLMWGGIGVLVGGYVGSRLAEESNSKIEFTNVAKKV